MPVTTVTPVVVAGIRREIAHNLEHLLQHVLGCPPRWDGFLQHRKGLRIRSGWQS